MENIFASSFQLVRLQGLHWQVYLWPKIIKGRTIYEEIRTLYFKDKGNEMLFNSIKEPLTDFY